MKLTSSFLVLLVLLAGWSPALAGSLDLSGPLTSMELMEMSRLSPRLVTPQGQVATATAPSSDSSWDGAWIGAGIGVVAGMLIAPRVICGRNDSECTVIVRGAIGIPAVAGGLGLGWLVDHLRK